MVWNDKYLWCHGYLLSNVINCVSQGQSMKRIKGGYVPGSKCAGGQIVLDCSLNWWFETINTCDVMPTYFRMPSKYSSGPKSAGIKFGVNLGSKISGDQSWFGPGSNCAWSLTQLMVRNDKYLWCHAYLLSNAIKVFPWPRFFGKCSSHRPCLHIRIKVKERKSRFICSL